MVSDYLTCDILTQHQSFAVVSLHYGCSLMSHSNRVTGVSHRYLIHTASSAGQLLQHF